MLIIYKHLLSSAELEFRTNPNVKHDTQCAITTTSDNPKITARGTRGNPEETKVYMSEIAKKAKEGVIEPSRAPWCPNALLFQRRQNSHGYRLQIMVIDVLQGTHWLTGMDCVQAFHQIPMADQRSRDLTKFRGPSGGLYRYRYMPMGIANAMAIWSRFIDTTMAGMDDLVLCYAWITYLVFSQSSKAEDHIADLEKMSSNSLRKTASRSKHPSSRFCLKIMPFVGVVNNEKRDDTRQRDRQLRLTS